MNVLKFLENAKPLFMLNTVGLDLLPFLFIKVYFNV